MAGQHSHSVRHENRNRSLLLPGLRWRSWVFVMILFGNAQLRAESPKQQPTEPDGQAGSNDSGRASERDLGEVI